MIEPPRDSLIVVAGEALIDLIVEPDGGLSAIPGGGADKNAPALGRLGRHVAFLGRISTDRFGRLLRANLAADGVATDLVVSTDDPTTLAIAELDQHGTASYQFYLDGTSAPGLVDVDASGVVTPAIGALHVGTLGLVLEPIGTTIEGLVGATPETVLVMLDPNCRPSATREAAAFRARIERIGRRADVVKVSDDDLRFLYPSLTIDDAIDRLVGLGARLVLRTDGGGSVEVRTATERVTVPVPQVEVVDTVGAGDAFGGGFLVSWIGAGRGRDALGSMEHVLEAVAFAIRVAGFTCTRAGADPPTLADLGTAPV